MTALVPMPVLLPMLGAALTVLGSRRATLQRVVAVTVVAAVAVLAAALLVTADRRGPLVATLGGWAAPVGIALVADRLSALLLLVSALVTMAVLVFAIDQRVTMEGGRGTSTTFHPMFLMLTAGVSLAYLTGDLFTLFVAFEVTLTASYVLITRSTNTVRIRANMTYVIVGLTSSLLFLTTIAMVYAATGTVNLADLAGKLGEQSGGVQTVLALLLVVVFGIKSAVVPLHLWLPDSYPHAPGPVAALFAGILTKVSFYAILRTQTLLFEHPAPWGLLLGLAVATMLLGALGALAQNDLNRVLSFLLISHIGVMLFGLAVFDAAGVAAATLYAAHHITVLATLFLVVSLITQRTGTVELDRMGGLARTAPGVAVLFGIAALTLAGVPPTAGFVAKLGLLQAGASAGTATTIVAGAVVLASFLTLVALTRIWVRVFWSPWQPPHHDDDPADELVVGTARSTPAMYAATAGLMAASLAIAVFAGPLSALTARAGLDLVDREPYRVAVLGGRNR